jgi:tmRNA-binding protein
MEHGGQGRIGRTHRGNRRARYDYFIEERFEAGVALQGWEVKACARAASSCRSPMCS